MSSPGQPGPAARCQAPCTIRTCVPLTLAAQLTRVLESVNRDRLFISPPLPLHPVSLKVCMWKCVGGGGVRIACEQTCADFCLEDFPEVNFPSYGRRGAGSISTRKTKCSQCHWLQKGYIPHLRRHLRKDMLAMLLLNRWTTTNTISFFNLYSHKNSHLFKVKISIEFSNTVSIFK